MTASGLDAHAKPPSKIRDVYKRYQKTSLSKLHDQTDLIDCQNLSSRQDVDRLRQLSPGLRQTFYDFIHANENSACPPLELDIAEEPSIYQVPSIPGLLIYPSLLPPTIQLSFLDKLLHRDLSNPQHQTNVHMHYNIPYPAQNSFFDPSASALIFQPKDLIVHKPLTTTQFLSKKLRWATLGGQYDWTNKVYPPTDPPPFPADIKRLVEGCFPMKAEAAIVNLYSPGDTLSLHRDVSEECDRPLASISLGCEALFIVGLEQDGADGEANVATIRLRSGDAVLMSGESRYAWHGVPKVLEGTCPPFMQEWPFHFGADDTSHYNDWKGWMRGKRINLNVRQMFA